MTRGMEDLEGGTYFRSENLGRGVLNLRPKFRGGIKFETKF